MEPQAGLTLFNAIATAGKAIYDIAQGTSKLETKQQLMEVYDILMNLKREASELEDQNHSLKEKLRFKGDDFEFKNPFWFDKKHPDRALCPKCFGEKAASPMSETYDMLGRAYTPCHVRKCLVCGHIVVEREVTEPNPTLHFRLD